jgi:metallophosphoesterase (TIGR00282 family)
MKLLFCGDVVGRSGRDAVVFHIPLLRKELALDAVVVSGDNAAGGFGITPAVCADFFAAGVDVVTGGDHVWDQKEAYAYLAREKRLLRPHNFPASAPGSGVFVLTAASGKKLLVVHVLGQVFHKEHTACPFATTDEALRAHPMPGSVQAVLVDIHAEATSEKTAMGQYFDGRASVVVGSHTHIPTADARVLPKGTAYQTDCGMCGDYDSVIGFAPEGPLTRFLSKIPKARMEPAAGEATLCALYVETDDATGKAVACRAIRRGGVLAGC